MYQMYRPLLDALARRGADAIALQSAADEAERTGRSIRDVLINDRVVTEVELTEASGDVYGISSVDLVGFPIDAAAAAAIPLPLVLRHRVLGIAHHRRRAGRRGQRPGRRRRPRRHPRRDQPGRPSGRGGPQRAAQGHRPAAARGQRPRRRGRVAAGRPGTDRLEPDDRRRRRADRAVRELDPRPGDPEPRVRHPPRADRGRPAHPLPHRRRAARDRRRARARSRRRSSRV